MPGLRMGSWAVLLAMAASGAAYANVIGIPHAEFRQLYPLGPNGRVTIENRYGDVSVMGWDRDDVLVEAVKRSGSGDSRRLDAAQIIVEPMDGALTIHTQYGPDAESAPKVEYRISMPRTASLENVNLGNGRLTIRGVAGGVKASSKNGSIKAEMLEGSAELSTVNGQLEAGFNRVGAGRPITLSSINGPIKLMLPGGARASLHAHNVSGGIETEFGRPARVNGAHELSVAHPGGAQIHLTNVNGGISIHSNGSKPERPI